MVLDLGGSAMAFDRMGYDGQNVTNTMSSTSRAILYVFKPHRRQFEDVAMRPYQYNFTDSFASTMQEIGSQAKRGNANSNRMVSDLMNTTNFNQFITPSVRPDMVFRASQLSDCYRFILILTDEGRALIGGNTAISTLPNAQMRRIYTGYFQDEPYNPMTFSDTRRTLNPDAHMVITHKTMVNLSTEMNRFGPTSMLKTIGSEEIAHSDLSHALTGHLSRTNNDLHLMTPENCLNAVEVTSEGYSYAMPGVSGVMTKSKAPEPVSDIWERPDQNVRHIVNGVINFQEETGHRNQLHTHRGQQAFADNFLDEGFGRTKLAGMMAIPQMRKMGEFDLDLTRIITPETINRLVNNRLEIQPVGGDRPLEYETADQFQASITNQQSFLIASVICPILNSAGLNSIQFRYQIAHMGGDVQDDFQIFGAEPCIVIPNEDVVSKALAVKHELINGIFRIIFESFGAFDVAVSAFTTGVTSVRLSLVDMGITNPIDFCLPSVMGGLISPLIGDGVYNMANSQALENLYGHATGMNLERPAGFDDDAMDFMNYARDMASKDLMTIDPSHPGMNLDLLGLDTGKMGLD